MEQPLISNYLEEERMALAGAWNGVQKELRDAIVFRLAVLRYYQDLRWEQLAIRLLGCSAEEFSKDLPPMVYLEPQESLYSMIDIAEGASLYSTGQEVQVCEHCCLLPIRHIDIQLDTKQKELEIELQLHKESRAHEIRFFIQVDSNVDWEWIQAIQTMCQVNMEWSDSQGNEHIKVLPREKCLIFPSVSTISWNRLAIRDPHYRSEFHFRLPVECDQWQMLRFTFQLNQLPCGRLPKIHWNYIRVNLVARETLPWRCQKGTGQISLPRTSVCWGVNEVHSIPSRDRFVKRIVGAGFHEFGSHQYFIETLDESLEGEYLVDVLLEYKQRDCIVWEYNGAISQRFQRSSEVYEGVRGLHGASLFQALAEPTCIPSSISSKTQEYMAWNTRLDRIRSLYD